METKLITDGQRLVGARSRHGYTIPTYDDGFGPLWIHRDSMGISGIVRARTWEEAYEICEDEFFPEASETMEEIVKEYGFRVRPFVVISDATGKERKATPSDYPFSKTDCAFVRHAEESTPDADAWEDHHLFQEAFGFRPNGPRSGNNAGGTPRDPIGHGIYAKDLNGDWLDRLTPEFAEELGITLQIENEE